MKRFQLMQRVNVEGLYGAVQEALPHLKQSPQGQGRIVVVCPPIYSRFFRGKTAYAMGKVGMSVLVKGLAMDFEREGLRGMGVVGIWPAAVSFFFLCSFFCLLLFCLLFFLSSFLFAFFSFCLLFFLSSFLFVFFSFCLLFFSLPFFRPFFLLGLEGTGG